jgi:hypothetical protein
VLETLILWLPLGQKNKQRIGYWFFKKGCKDIRRAAILFYCTECPMASHLAHQMLQAGEKSAGEDEMVHEICFN